MHDVLTYFIAGLLVLLAAMLALIYHKLSGAIDRLAQSLPCVAGNVFTQLEALDALHRELRLQHALQPTRGWAASPDFLRTVMMHALRNSPECIVECSSGVSTVVLARCAQLAGRGHVHSLEHDASFAELTRLELERQGLTSWATVYDAPLQPLALQGWNGQWYAHDVLPTDLRVDLLVIDGPPWFASAQARYPAMPVLHDRLTAAAAIYLDDADRPEEQAIVKRWLADFPGLRQMQAPKCEKGCVALARS